MNLVPIQKIFDPDLRDPEYVAQYLQQTLMEEDLAVLKLALQDIARANDTASASDALKKLRLQIHIQTTKIPTAA